MSESVTIQKSLYEQQIAWLEIALKGSLAWSNESGRKNQGKTIEAEYYIAPNFEGFDFTPYQGRLNFTGFHFGAGTNFSRAKFAEGDTIRFVNCVFHGDALFHEMVASGEVIFENCKFSGYFYFSESRITHIGVTNSQFCGPVDFDNCIFGAVATSANDIVRFGDGKLYRKKPSPDSPNQGPAIEINANFYNTEFSAAASFKNCKFLVPTFFVETLLHGNITFENSTFFDVDFTAKQPSNTEFSIFKNVKYFGHVKIKGRNLEADLSGATFHQIPVIENCTNANKLDLAGTQFKFTGKSRCPLFSDWTTDRKVLLNIRVLRKIAEETKNHDLERDLYIEERKAERGIYFSQLWRKIKWNRFSLDVRFNALGKLFAHSINIIFGWFYWLFSDYGRSLVRPVIWYLISFFAFNQIYSQIFTDVWKKAPTSLQQEIGTKVSADSYNQIFQSLSFANHIPIIGNIALDAEAKRTLFCGFTPTQNTILCLAPKYYNGLLITENLLVGVLIFLFALAIRNYFKIK